MPEPTETPVLRLASNTTGSVMPMAAVGLLMLTALIGGGVDLSRAYKVQNRLQAACDAGVLAGRKAVGDNGFNDNAEEEATSYFDANFKDTVQGTRETVFNAISEDNGNSVNATARTVMATTIMRIFGQEEISLSVNCTASMGVGNSDITMVLDTTGSMDWDLDGSQTRIEALRDAMLSFHDTVDEATSGSNARIRYSLVPYSSAVNAGALLDPDWLVDSYIYQSRQWVTETRQDTILVGFEDPTVETDTEIGDESSSQWSRYSNTRYRSYSTCVSALPANVAWAAYGSPRSSSNTYTNEIGQQVTESVTEQDQRQINYACFGSGTRYYINRQYVYRTATTTSSSTADPIYELSDPYTVTEMQYKPVTFDTSRFKTFSATTTPTGTNGANQTSTWDGCIIERATVADSDFTFDPESRAISPDGALDLDIDLEPDSGDPNTQWAPMWPQISYARGIRRSGRSSLTWQDSTPLLAGELVSSYCPSAASLLAEMDRDEFEEQTRLLVPRGSTYHDIGILWGARLSSPTGLFSENVNEEPDNGATVSRHLIFMTDGEMAPSNSILSAYGIEYYDKRVTGNGTNNLIGRHNARFLALCEAVKGRGIRLWVIALATSLTGDLQTCASEDSAFTAADAVELNTAFQEIANQVGELRVSQ